jgi:hypothetical protein
MSTHLATGIRFTAALLPAAPNGQHDFHCGVISHRRIVLYASPSTATKE